MTLAQHSAATPEHGTPQEILAMGRRVLGGDFDLDPCSNEMWNRNVRAARFISAEENGLRSDWRARPGLRISCNPPGGLVPEFWDACVRAWSAGACVFWIGFSLEQLLYLQRHGLFDKRIRRVIPPRRIAWIKGFVEPVQGGLFGAPELPEPVTGDSPTHGNYLALLPLDGRAGDDQIRRWHDECALMSAEVF